MITYTYKMRTDTVTDELGNEHTVYGIELYENDNTAPTRIISDLFCEREAAEWFVELCSRLELCPEQLDDAVADAIAA